MTFEMQEKHFLFELLCRDNEFCNGFPVLFIEQGKLADGIKACFSGAGHNYVCWITRYFLKTWFSLV